MTKTNKKVFKTKDVNGNEIELAIRRLTPKESIEAQKEYNKGLRIALDSGAYFRQKLDSLLREQGLWSDEDDQKVLELTRKVIENSKKLKDKSYDVVEEGREIANDLKAAREELQRLTFRRDGEDAVTAEYQAEMARLNYTIATCTVYNTDGKPYFKNLEDFHNRIDEEATLSATAELMLFLNDIDPEYEKKLPENEFFATYPVENKEETNIPDDESRPSE